MLKFREIDYKTDLSQVVQLLNSSLNTTHTEEAFLWKHFENPFGKSYGLLALDREKLVGIRMFMKWQFESKSKIIRAVRPVDTCTDQKYRGRGIFHDLTQACLKKLEGEYDIVFNTPNENSRPGNLKMGWTSIKNAGFRYKFGIPNPLNRDLDYDTVSPEEVVFDSKWQEEVDIQTKLSSAFLQWRYTNPGYKFARFNSSKLIVYKVLRLRGIKTVVLLDSFGISGNFSNYLFSICKKNKAPVIYFLDNIKNKRLQFLFDMYRGRQIVVSKDDRYKISEDMHFSLGDLEARL